MIGARTKVFLVDDHPLVRDWLKNLLQMEVDFEVVGEAARVRGNWLLPGNKINDEEQLFATLRGRGLKGDLWRYVTRLGLGRAIAGTGRSQPLP